MNVRRTTAQDAILAQHYEGFEPHEPKPSQRRAGRVPSQFEASMAGPFWGPKLGQQSLKYMLKLGSFLGTILIYLLVDLGFHFGVSF